MNSPTQHPLTVDELIEQLQKIREEYGNLPINLLVDAESAVQAASNVFVAEYEVYIES